MDGLEVLLRGVFVSAGWRVEQADLRSGFSFDLIAESESSIAFIKVLSARANLGETANGLTGEVAAAMSNLGEDPKTWEAYLVLVLTSGYDEMLPEVQRVQNDLNYCRKIVLNAAKWSSAVDPAGEMESDLAFLFPFRIAPVDQIPDVRSLLVAHLIAKGVHEDTAAALVDNFDEPDCQCISRLFEVTRSEIQDAADEN